MAVIPLVQITKARVSKLAGVDSTLLSTPAFLFATELQILHGIRQYPNSFFSVASFGYVLACVHHQQVNLGAFRSYLDFG